VRLDRLPDDPDDAQRAWCRRRAECLRVADARRWKRWGCGSPDAPCEAFEPSRPDDLATSVAGLLALHHAALHPELDAHRGRRERSK
jgi:hypothetical protein